jgi:hypothetical protein
MSETDQAVHDETTEQTDAPESPDTAETPEAVAESKAAPDKPAPVELTPGA